MMHSTTNNSSLDTYVGREIAKRFLESKEVAETQLPVYTHSNVSVSVHLHKLGDHDVCPLKQLHILLAVKTHTDHQHTDQNC